MCSKKCQWCSAPIPPYAVLCPPCEEVYIEILADRRDAEEVFA